MSGTTHFDQFSLYYDVCVQQQDNKKYDMELYVVLAHLKYTLPCFFVVAYLYQYNMIESRSWIFLCMVFYHNGIPSYPPFSK